MNTKPEQIQTGSNADTAEHNNIIAAHVSATDVTEVTGEELDQVDGGHAPIKVVNPGDNMNIAGRNGGAPTGIVYF